MSEMTEQEKVKLSMVEQFATNDKDLRERVEKLEKAVRYLARKDSHDSQIRRSRIYDMLGYGEEKEEINE